MACFADRAPCLPSRTCSISSRTNSPAAVDGALPRRRAFFARSTVLASGISKPSLARVPSNSRTSYAYADYATALARCALSARFGRSGGFLCAESNGETARSVRDVHVFRPSITRPILRAAAVSTLTCRGLGEARGDAGSISRSSRSGAPPGAEARSPRRRQRHAGARFATGRCRRRLRGGPRARRAARRVRRPKVGGARNESFDGTHRCRRHAHPRRGADFGRANPARDGRRGRPTRSSRTRPRRALLPRRSSTAAHDGPFDLARRRRSHSACDARGSHARPPRVPARARDRRVPSTRWSEVGGSRAPQGRCYFGRRVERITALVRRGRPSLGARRSQSLVASAAPGSGPPSRRLARGQHADGAAHARAAVPAIAAGIFGEVLLVVVLGVVKRRSLRDLGGDGAVALFGESLLVRIA